jgi:hypothetical protein
MKLKQRNIPTLLEFYKAKNLTPTWKCFSNVFQNGENFVAQPVTWQIHVYRILDEQKLCLKRIHNLRFEIRVVEKSDYYTSLFCCSFSG